MNELTEDWMLYDVPNKKIAQYKLLALPLQQFIAEVFKEHDLGVNVNIPICNVWLALHSHMDDEVPLFLKEQFRMSYQVRFFKLEYIEYNKTIHQFFMKNA